VVQVVVVVVVVIVVYHEQLYSYLKRSGTACVSKAVLPATQHSYSRPLHMHYEIGSTEIRHNLK